MKRAKSLVDLIALYPHHHKPSCLLSHCTHQLRYYPDDRKANPVCSDPLLRMHHKYIVDTIVQLNKEFEVVGPAVYEVNIDNKLVDANNGLDCFCPDQYYSSWLLYELTPSC